ncbi:MAG: RDD family protein, partial [Methanobacterium sp.]
WVPLAAVVIVAYFTYFEGKYSTTPGKNVMKLKVRAIKGEIGYKKTLIRNLSKILWFPLVVDVIVGLAMGKPRERYLDRLAKTEVVKTEEVEDPQKNLEQSTSSD